MNPKISLQDGRLQMEALEALCSQLSCSPNLERGQGLPGETPGDAFTLGLWNQGTPAPQVSGMRGHLHPQPLGSGGACTPGLWDQGTPASRVSGIRGHLHPRCQGSGDTYTPGVRDQGRPAP
ncbi:unnamed protein product [Rangifer tarandus platyrhynchus]|uniref:Uncharacterized protein n=2 Tax=Rangifer tarandus platyrhynchus TaxID=3082113 RepID=A0ABN8XXQ2_RANTA|nr:unnamed protein product [Rangifer tarandus platyrhynchus]